MTDPTPEKIFKAYSQKFIEVVQNPKYDSILSEQIKLEFYALYKFSLEGPCNIPKPGMFQFERKAKYDAWNKLTDEDNPDRVLSKVEAQLAYVDKFTSLFPEEVDSIDLNNVKNTLSFELGNMGTFGKNIYGNNLGQCSAALNIAGSGANLPDFNDNKLSKDAETNLFLKLVQEDNLEAIQVMYENNPNVILLRDLDGNSCLHWAADRNSRKFLLDFFVTIFKNNTGRFCWTIQENKQADCLDEEKFNVNWQNSFGETALHLANEEDIFDCLKDKFKIDFNILDKDGYKAEL